MLIIMEVNWKNNFIVRFALFTNISQPLLLLEMAEAAESGQKRRQCVSIAFTFCIPLIIGTY